VLNFAISKEEKKKRKKERKRSNSVWEGMPLNRSHIGPSV
jgi:hypothetical protein